MCMNCLDTYALMEIHKGNPHYASLLDERFVISELTMAEFYAVLLREHDEKTADYWHKKLVFYARPADLDLLISAVKFRHEHKKQNISFFDAVGYEFARSNGYKFVTGDKAFKGMVGINFIK